MEIEIVQPNASLNWNPKTQEDAVQHFHLTDFVLTSLSGQLASILLPPTAGDTSTFYNLRGNLMSPHNHNTRELCSVLVNSYYIDVGSNTEGDDATQGFWMTGEDPDVRFQLVYPAAPEYVLYASGILHLASERRLFRNYEFPYDSGTCYHMTDFILMDKALGTSQTLILPRSGNKMFVLQGRVKLNPESMQMDEQIQLSHHGDYSQLCIRTYVTTKYLVDFGRELVQKEPQIWMQDNYANWIKLVGPCHRDYRLDYDTAMRHTLNNVQKYNWRSEDAQIWRHVTNFKLTTEAGELHPLEITALNSVFILWGDLCAPPTSDCPTIPIKVYVKCFSVDMGRESGDIDQGVWMRDLQTIDNWYKLEAPAVPEYRPFADPIFHKTKKFLEFYDALIYQDCSEEYTLSYEDEDGIERFYCIWEVKDIHRVAEPKFDLDFVRDNFDFILHYLDFDLARSTVLVESMERLSLQAGDHNGLCASVATTSSSTVLAEFNGELSSGGATASAASAAQQTATNQANEARELAKAEAKKEAKEAKRAKKKAERQKEKEKEKAQAKAKAAESKAEGSSATAGKKRPLDASTSRSAEEVARELAAKAQKVASMLTATATATGAAAAATSSTTTSGPSVPVASSSSAATVAKPIKKKQVLELLDSPHSLSEAHVPRVSITAGLVAENIENAFAAEYDRPNTTVHPVNPVTLTQNIPTFKNSSNSNSQAAVSVPATSKPLSSALPPQAPASTSTDTKAPSAQGPLQDSGPAHRREDGQQEVVGQKRERSIDKHDPLAKDASKHPRPSDSRDGDKDNRGSRDGREEGLRPVGREDSRDGDLRAGGWDGRDHHRGAGNTTSTSSSTSARIAESERWRDDRHPRDRGGGSGGVDAFGRDRGGPTPYNRERDGGRVWEGSRDRAAGGYSEGPSDRTRDLSSSGITCRYCKSKRKAYKCMNNRHIDGQFMPEDSTSYGNRPRDPARSSVENTSSSNSSSYGVSAGPPVLNRATSVERDNRAENNKEPTRSSSSSSERYPDHSSMAPSATVPVVVAQEKQPLRISPPPVEFSTSRPQFSPIDPTSPSFAAFSAETTTGDDSDNRWVAKLKKDDIQQERDKYAKKHQHLQHDEQSVSQRMLFSSSAGSADFLQRLTSVNSKGGTAAKWGAALSVTTARPVPNGGSSGALPAAAAATSTGVSGGQFALEMVPLGTREADPKRRLAMSSMNSVGVYSTVQSSPRAVAAAAPYVPPAPVDLTLQPTKSNLRRDSGKPRSERKISWPDTVEGGVLSKVFVFENIPYVLDGDVGGGPMWGSGASSDSHFSSDT